VGVTVHWTVTGAAPLVSLDEDECKKSYKPISKPFAKETQTIKPLAKKPFSKEKTKKKTIEQKPNKT